MISFSDMNSKKNAVGRPQYQNVNLVYGETLIEMVFMVRSSCVSDHLEAHGQAGVYPSLPAAEICVCLEEEKIGINRGFCLFVNLVRNKTDVHVIFNYMQLAYFLCSLIFRNSGICRKSCS